MKRLLVAATLAVGAVLGPSAYAVTFTTGAAGSGPQSPTGFGSLKYYNDFSVGANGLNGGGLRTGTNDSLYAAPVGDSTQYYAVGPEAGTPASLAISGFDRVSLYWGSIDSYNAISFLGAGGTVLQSFTGTQIVGPTTPSGQDSRTVTFSLNPTEAAAVTGIRFASSINAFEFDNLAIGSAVPEAATWAMMVMGLGMVGGSLRRRQKVSTRVSFAWV